METRLGNGVGTAMEQITGRVAKWEEEKEDRLKQWQEEMGHMKCEQVSKEWNSPTQNKPMTG